MKKPIEEFWEYFLKNNSELLSAAISYDRPRFSELFENLDKKICNLKEEMELVLFIDENDFFGKLVVLTKGNADLKLAGIKLLEQAPILENWKYFLGLPFSGISNSTSLIHKNREIPIVSEHIWIHIHKQYKSSNKYHLEIYVDLKEKGISKQALRAAVKDIFLTYFGDEIFFTWISRFKILQRKFKNRKFIPLWALRDFFVHNF